MCFSELFDGGDGAARKAAATGDFFLGEISLQALVAEAFAEFDLNLGVGEEVEHGEWKAAQRRADAGNLSEILLDGKVAVFQMSGMSLKEARLSLS